MRGTIVAYCKWNLAKELKSTPMILISEILDIMYYILYVFPIFSSSKVTKLVMLRDIQQRITNKISSNLN